MLLPQDKQSKRLLAVFSLNVTIPNSNVLVSSIWGIRGKVKLD